MAPALTIRIGELRHNRAQQMGLAPGSIRLEYQGRFKLQLDLSIYIQIAYCVQGA